MRSSKSRSRSKSNRPRSIGNIVNRVFDSSGPEGKVRGTPQQIIEKYLILARDAQLSNDRVAAENFLQHAEHYTRMLAEAQRELAAEQEQRRPQEFNQNSGGGNGQNGGQGNYQNGQNRDRPYRDERQEPRGEQRPDPRFEPQPDLAPARSATMMDFIDDLSDSGLVETPETRNTEGMAPRIEPQDRRDRPARPEQTQDRRQERPERREERKPKPEGAVRQDKPRAEGDAAQPAEHATGEAPAAGQRRNRPPRKSRSEGSPGDDTSGPAEAAE